MSKRDFLSHLNDTILESLARVYNVQISPWAGRDDYINALVNSRKATLPRIKKTLRM